MFDLIECFPMIDNIDPLRLLNLVASQVHISQPRF
jgi:hypothetical protein